MKFSIIIPAHNEQDIILDTVIDLYNLLMKNNITDVEIVVVNDNSSDNTYHILKNLEKQTNNMILLNNKYPKGFGNAIKFGIENSKGDYIIIVMGDKSDDINNIIDYIYYANKGYDITNAFKLYKKSLVLNHIPLQADSFNITVELALKAILQEPKYIQIPINWFGRKKGYSKFSVIKNAYKYLSIIIYYYQEYKK